MNLAQIQALAVSADPAAGHYFSEHRSQEPYTVWAEYREIPMGVDDGRREKWKFQIDRYAREEHDAVAGRIYQALKREIGVHFQYQTDYETDSGYIHHIFDCEG